MSNNYLNNALRAGLRALGYEVRKIVKPEKRELHPLTFPYFVKDQGAVFELPLNIGRSGCHLIWGTEDVFEIAVKAALETSESSTEEKIRSVLRASLRLPRNAANRVGLDDTESPVLAKEPGWLYLLPWDRETLEQRKTNIDKTILQENLKQGLNRSAFDGATWGDTEKLEVEVARLSYLLNSIQINGFRPVPRDGTEICGTICVSDGGKFVWLVTGGNHRLAVLRALGVDCVSVRVNSWVHRSDVEYWPNVVSGIYTAKSALKVFDKLFDSGLT